MSSERINGRNPQAFVIDDFNYSPATMSAFGTLEADGLTPVVQGDFIYGLNTQIWDTAVTSGTGATVDTDSGNLRIQSGTDAAGYAYIQSLKPIKYRAGQGCRLRITPLFTQGVASSVQYWGAGAIVSNEIYDGYFFGYNGASFGIAHYARGSQLSFTAQEDWNGDKCLWYDPTKGTPAQIVYPYLGYGSIFFMLQNHNTGYWNLCHTIRYPNTTTATQMSNPTVYVMGFAQNSGNTSNLTMRAGSIGAFISGKRSYVGDPKWSAKSNKSSITTELNILTLKNATTYNGVSNRGLIRLRNISLGSSAASGVATLDFVWNTTLGGSPSYTTINGSTADGGATITSGNSIASYDVAGTTITGGERRFSLTVDNPNSSIINLEPYDLFIIPGDTLTFGATSSISSTVGLSINWGEDI